MDYKLILKPRAEDDLSEGIQWYESRLKGLGLRFLSQVEKYLEIIRKNPFQYPIRKKQYRETFIKKFPYIIIYEIIENEIVVYSVFNTYQNPDSKP